MNTQYISIDDLRRNFGEIKKKLLFVDFILTDRGNPIGILKATSTMKRNIMMETAGSLKGTQVDSDSFWNEVLKKKSRKDDIRL